MLKLEEIKKDAQVKGIIDGQIVRIVTIEPVGEHALTVYYKDNKGALFPLRVGEYFNSTR